MNRLGGNASHPYSGLGQDGWIRGANLEMKSMERGASPPNPPPEGYSCFSTASWLGVWHGREKEQATRGLDYRSAVLQPASFATVATNSSGLTGLATCI